MRGRKIMGGRKRKTFRRKSTRRRRHRGGMDQSVKNFKRKNRKKREPHVAFKEEAAKHEAKMVASGEEPAKKNMYWGTHGRAMRRRSDDNDWLDADGQARVW